MTRLRVIASRLIGHLATRGRGDELDSEIRTHLELLAEEQVRRGLSLREARTAARREFGGVDQVKERYRDQRGIPFLESFTQDTSPVVRGAG